MQGENQLFYQEEAIVPDEADNYHHYNLPSQNAEEAENTYDNQGGYMRVDEECGVYSQENELFEENIEDREN